MTFILVLLLFSLVSSALVSGTEYYSDKYDYMDVDAILNNERLLNQYMACILDEGPCTADGRSLKRILPDALATSCEKCNMKQRQLARKISNYLKERRPKVWSMFLDRYDPNKEYIATFEAFLAQVEK